MHLCSELWKSLTTCSPVLTWPSPCRSFSHTKTLHQVCMHTIGPDSWPMFKNYCKSCTTCSHTKPVCHKPYGLLKQLMIPKKPWNSISMNFIEKLPPSSGYTSILVIVDHLSKQSLFIPTHDTITSLNLHNSLFYMAFPSTVSQATPLPIAVWNLYPTSSSPWNCIGYEASFHFGYHPEGDGQTEWNNQTLEQYLQVYCNYHKTTGLNSFHFLSLLKQYS